MALRNLQMLKVLERIAARAAQAGVDVLALKGAALNLTVTAGPAERPMGDLDLLVRAEQLPAVQEALAAAGCRVGKDLVRPDFFPRFCFERQYLAGRLHPVTIDLHVRPFRPLRFAQVIPEQAFWENSQSVAIGHHAIKIPGREDMLIHLAAHSAMHGNSRRMWLLDMLRWTRAFECEFDWTRFVELARSWGLALPVRSGLEAAEKELGSFIPASVTDALGKARVNWRDRMALRHAPHDADAPGGHVLVDALCTPKPSFVAGYLAASLLPEPRQMAEWYDWRHTGWRSAAHAVRLLSPAIRRVPFIWNRLHKLERRDAGQGAMAVFAATVLAAGETIADWTAVDDGGKAHRIRHSCRPNVRLDRGVLRAIRAIDTGEEITRDHGLHACGCRQGRRECA
jgi:hypothetical protein